MNRITLNPSVMDGKPCIRGMRVTVGLIVGLVVMGHSAEEILRDYPYLEAEDIPAALSYAAGLVQALEVSLRVMEKGGSSLEEPPFSCVPAISA